MSDAVTAPFRNPLVVALDVDGRDEALRLADVLADVAGGFKLGPRLCLRYGQELMREMSLRAPVFADNKHFDIPSTMVAAVRASFEAGASVATVHALAGPEALRAVADLEKEFLDGGRLVRVLAVTVLTSWGQESLPSSLKEDPLAEHVVRLAGEVRASGLTGVVCSPQELDLLRGQGLFLLTPGIRFREDDRGDQKRVAGPSEALLAGASALVVGRPIVHAPDPKAAALGFLRACSPG